MGRATFNKLLLSVILGLTGLGTQAPEEPDYVNHQKVSRDNAIGVRAGGTSGVSYKHKLSGKNAAELIIGRTGYSYGLTGLYHHVVQTTAAGLSVYFGGGGHLAKPFQKTYLVSDEGETLSRAGTFNSGRVIVGVDGLIGLEFLFHELPVSVNTELKPYAEFFRWTNSTIVRLDPGVGLRYHF